MVLPVGGEVGRFPDGDEFIDVVAAPDATKVNPCWSWPRTTKPSPFGAAVGPVGVGILHMSCKRCW